MPRPSPRSGGVFLPFSPARRDQFEKGLLMAWYNDLFTARRKSVSAFKETGVTGTPVMAGYVVDREKNPILKGPRKYNTYEDMVANVAIISAGVRYYTALIGSSEWSVEPFDESSESQARADALEQIINDTQQTWNDIVKTASLYQFNGFGILEMTAKRRTDGTIGIKSIENRPCRTIVKWDVDESGTVLGVEQQIPMSGQSVYIPRNKFIYLVDNVLTDSPEGFGLFRSMAESAFRLQELQIIEKVGIDRDLRGIPIGRAPYADLAAWAGDDEDRKRQVKIALEGLENMVSIVRKGERTGIMLDSKPYESITEGSTSASKSATSVRQWDIELMNTTASGLSEVGNVIDRLNYDLARIMGVENLLLGSGSTGSLALSSDKTKSLMLTINSILADISARFNSDLVPFLAKLNGWPEDQLPRLTFSEVGQTTVADLAATVRDFASAGITLQRGDEAVNELFNMAGLTPPEADEMDDLVTGSPNVTVPDDEENI